MARVVKEVRQPSTVGTVVFILWGLIAWAAQLTVVYGGHTLLCAMGWTSVAVSVLILITTVVALTLVAPMLFWPHRAARAARLDPADEDTRHLIRIARYLALLSSVAIVWTGVTFLAVDACGLAR